MKKRSIIVLTLLAGCFTNSFAQKGEKTLTVEVSNEWTQNKTDEPIVIDLNNLKAGFNIKSATVWEGNKEIPSQLDDLNGDARADELAFLIDMPAKSNKSFRIILSSEKSEKNYPARTYAQMKAYGHNNKFANITGFSAAGTENVYSFVYHHGPAIGILRCLCLRQRVQPGFRPGQFRICPGLVMRDGFEVQAVAFGLDAEALVRPQVALQYLPGHVVTSAVGRQCPVRLRDIGTQFGCPGRHGCLAVQAFHALRCGADAVFHGAEDRRNRWT